MRFFINNNNGTALIITLLVIAALTTLAVAFSQETGIEVNLTEYSKDNRMAHQIASSGANMALSLLVQDLSDDGDDGDKVDSLDDPWAQFNEESIPWELEEDSTLKGKIIDENSKLNLNKLFESGETEINSESPRLILLFQALGLEESRSDTILDWLDKDSTERIEGAENLYYESLDTPYSCADGPLLTISQIHMIKGVDEIIKTLEKDGKNLFDYITITGDGKININTAPIEVLQSLDEGITDDIAQAIVDERQNARFLKISDLTDTGRSINLDSGIYDAIKELITVESNRFSIKMESIYRTSSCTITAIAERDKNKKDVKMVYWRIQ